MARSKRSPPSDQLGLFPGVSPRSLDEGEVVRPARRRPRMPPPVSSADRAQLVFDGFPVRSLRPGESFARRASDLARRLQLLEREAVSHLDMTLPQVHALHALRDRNSLRMQDLASELGLAQSTVTRLVTPLKRRHLIDRRPDLRDGRVTRTFLTDEGVDRADQVEAGERALYEGLLGRVPADHRDEVVAAIELLHRAVLEVFRER